MRKKIYLISLILLIASINIYSITETSTPTLTATNTKTFTMTATITSTITFTPTLTETFTRTYTVTSTYTEIFTPINTNTPTPVNIMLLGNKTIIESTSWITINSSTQKISFRFTAPYDILADKIRINVYNINNSPSFNIGIQGDVAGTDEPDGVYLSVTTTTITSGWNIVDIPDVNLNSGKIYHIVIEPYDLNGGEASFYVVNPNSKIFPAKQIYDANEDILIYDGSLWNLQNDMSIFVIENLNGEDFGNPYDTSQSLSIHSNGTTDNSDDYIGGEEFVGPDEVTKVAGVSIYALKTGNPSDPLYYMLYNETDKVTETADVFAYPADFTSTYSWVTKNFSSEVTLYPGKIYKLYFYSNGTGSDSSNRYLICADMNTPETFYNNVNYGGEEHYAIQSFGGTSNISKNYNQDIVFYFSEGNGPIPTDTITPTVTDTITPTNTETVTPTVTETITPTNTETVTPTNTDTVTPTNTDTVTSTQTVTATVTESITETVTPTVTETATSTSTDTETETTTSTHTITPTSTSTITLTATETNTLTITMTPTITLTNTNTYTATETYTFTETPTNTETSTKTYTHTFTETMTSTYTFTETNTPTETHTFTDTPTETETPTETNTFTDTQTPTETNTFTNTYTPTQTPTAAENIVLDKNYINISKGEKVWINIYNDKEEEKEIKIKIYNLSGELIRIIIAKGYVNKGWNKIYEWDGRNEEGKEVGKGIYFVVIEYDNRKIIKKLVILK